MSQTKFLGYDEELSRRLGRHGTGPEVTIDAVGHCELPKGMTSVPDDAFHHWDGALIGCKALTSISIPSSVIAIERNAFCDCSALRSITIPTSVTAIGGSAFARCCSLRSVTIPSSVMAIERDAFAGCTKLRAISIPPSVTEIRMHTFCNCYSLRSVSIPPVVTAIEQYAFYGCDLLRSVTIPTTATVSLDAFPDTTTVNRLAPAVMKARANMLFLGQGVLAYKRCRPALLTWLERTQLRLGAYAADGAACMRDREAYEAD